MNISGLALPTPLAQPASFKDGLASRRSPSDSVGTRWPSLPSRVRLPYRKLRLPFGHTAVPAKHPFAVEVALWTNYILAAPFAEPRFTAHAVGIRTAPFGGLRTLPRTLPLTALSGAVSGQATLRTVPGLRFATASDEGAIAGTEPRTGATVERVELGGAVLASACLGCLTHVGILREVERWCETAVKRLESQTPPLFTIPAEKPVQGEWEGWSDTSWMIKGGYVEDTE